MPEHRRVYLHLGLQKTGTSYLQGVVLRNRDRLAAQGLDLVPANRRDAFALMLMVRERYNPERDPAWASNALERFTAQLARAPGSRALLSQESLAAARRPQARRLVEACGDREVHLLLTVRDLGRQLPSAWQQELKAGKTEEYGHFLRRLQRDQESGSGSHPWIQLDPARVLGRWAGVVPPERVHVVTVPPRGSSPTLLLERFCRVLEVDPSGLVPQETASNTSLGRVQAEVLRRVNDGLPPELRRRQVYGDMGKRFFASRVLADQDTTRILVPQELRDWCHRVAAEQVGVLSSAEYRIEGDLADLRCRDEAFAEQDQVPTEAEVAAAAVNSLVRILALRGEATQRRPERTASVRVVRARVRRLLGRGAEAGPWDISEES